MSIPSDEDRERVPPAKDLSLSELTEGKNRIRLIAHVVDTSKTEAVINDGTAQISVNLGNIDREMKVGEVGRFILAITKESDNLRGYLLAFHALTKNEVEQYNRLTKLETRISKR